MADNICEICGKTFNAVGKGRWRYCSDCYFILESKKCKEKNETKEKTDWSKIIKIQKETGLSYGQIVQKGMI